jgi:hypothetical protein
MPADGSPIIFLARANRSVSFSTSAGEPVVSLSMFPPPPPSLQQPATELQHAATALQSVSLSNCRPAPPSSTRTCARASTCAGGGGSSSTDGGGGGGEGWELRRKTGEGAVAAVLHTPEVEEEAGDTPATSCNRAASVLQQTTGSSEWWGEEEGEEWGGEPATPLQLQCLGASIIGHELDRTF